MFTHWRYWLDFFIFPTAVVAAVAYDARSIGWFALMVFGLVLWTFAEYWIHRSVLHRWLWHGTHERHHAEPHEFVEAIWWYAPLLFGILIMMWPYNLWAGFALGYILFMAQHHRLHHSPLKPDTSLYEAAKQHGLHHRHTVCNFGITTHVWDRIFRTYRHG
jgi:sterol desaturase/sphingolipid hydroxylase (fatty acid hydroxylase superfamily)